MKFNTVLVQVAPILDSAKVPYMVSGGQALLLHGLEPFNSDVDISLGVGVDKRTMLQKMLAKMQLKIMVRSPANFVRQTHVLPTINDQTGTRVDFIFADTQYEKDAVERAVKLPVDGYTINFMTIEDMLIHKVVSGEQSDLDHASALLAKKPKLKVRLIQQTLTQFSEDLDKAFLPVFENLRKKKK